jgi:hypothetical protein
MQKTMPSVEGLEGKGGMTRRRELRAHLRARTGCIFLWSEGGAKTSEDPGAAVFIVIVIPPYCHTSEHPAPQQWMSQAMASLESCHDMARHGFARPDPTRQDGHNATWPDTIHSVCVHACLSGLNARNMHINCQADFTIARIT